MSNTYMTTVTSHINTASTLDDLFDKAEAQSKNIVASSERGAQIINVVMESCVFQNGLFAATFNYEIEIVAFTEIFESTPDDERGD